MVFIVLQYFYVVILISAIYSYVGVGIASYYHSKIKKDFIFVISAIVSVSVNLMVIYLGLFFDRENKVLWYIITVGTIVFSSVVLLNDPVDNELIKNPVTLREYIFNAKIAHFQDQDIQKFLRLRGLIYPAYIVLTLANQLISIADISLPLDISFYLQANEYSLIIVFAVNETIKFFKEKRYKNEI